MKKIKKTLAIGVITLSAFGIAGGTNMLVGEMTNSNIAEAATNKTVTIEGKKITVPSKGNKWVNSNGYWHFVKNGTLTKGWKWFTSADGEKVNHWSYFDNNGRLYTNWHSMGTKEGEKVTHWSYFGPNGWLRTGWQNMGTKTNPDGNQPQHMSYFGSNGWLRTGWVKLGKGTSEPDGNSAVHWSYFGPNGWLRTGWQSLGKGTSNPDGNAAKHWSFFGGNGWLRTGLVTFKKGTYNSDGNSPEHKSYFGGNGWLVTNKTFVLNGANYKADGKGWLTYVAPVKQNNQTKECNHTYEVVSKKVPVTKKREIKVYNVYGAVYKKGAKKPLEAGLMNIDTRKPIKQFSSYSEAFNYLSDLYIKEFVNYFKANNYLDDYYTEEKVRKMAEENLVSFPAATPNNNKNYEGIIPDHINTGASQYETYTDYQTETYLKCSKCGHEKKQ